MMLTMKNDFESVVEMYGGFPLREDFLEAGNAALEKLGLKAYIDDDEIRIPFLSRPYCDEEELEYYRDSGWEEEDIEDISKWILKLEAVIRIGKDLREGILETDMLCDVENVDEYDEVYPEDQICQEDADNAITVIETFLNLAVDVD